MSELETYERRAREAEELAELVSQPQNRQRYRALATAWRELLAAARAAQAEPDGEARAA